MRSYLPFRQIVNMNVGFFGIQFSFGLQQSNMSPIYQYLGADESRLPLLWLAGPMTGLLVQPITQPLRSAGHRYVVALPQWASCHQLRQWDNIYSLNGAKQQCQGTQPLIGSLICSPLQRTLVCRFNRWPVSVPAQRPDHRK